MIAHETPFSPSPVCRTRFILQDHACSIKPWTLVEQLLELKLGLVLERDVPVKLGTLAVVVENVVTPTDTILL